MLLFSFPSTNEHHNHSIFLPFSKTLNGSSDKSKDLSKTMCFGDTIWFTHYLEFKDDQTNNLQMQAAPKIQRA